MSEHTWEDTIEEVREVAAQNAQEATADTEVLADIARRLDRLEQRFSEQGINDLARAIERRIVSRMRYGRDPRIEVTGN